MPQYRKKPIIIEAIQWTGKNNREIQDFVTVSKQWIDGQIRIHTLEGWIIASPGDYIIRGVSGEFYPCRADIFEKTYESAE